MKRLLVLSNGAGEDAIAAKVLQRLPSEAKDAVACFPLVGAGKALEKEFELIGPRVLPPSEGLFRESWRLALQDLFQGVLAGHARQLAFLRRHRDQFGLAVAVGDLFPVLWAGLAGVNPLLFIGTAKSVFHHPYSSPERLLLHHFCRHCLVRDQATAQRLTELGLSAEWLGNAMMDEVVPTGRPLPLPEDSPLLTLLPGSRKEAPHVLPFQLEVVTTLNQRRSVHAAVAAAPGTGIEELAKICLANGWSLHSCPGEGALGLLEREGFSVPVFTGRLGDLLQKSSVALGQAGTANEQAAGAGVPVVAYDTRAGRSLRWYRGRQTGLLGDAVKVVAPHLPQLVDEIEWLLSDPTEHARRADIGRERMGPAGGSEKMAEAILGLWRQA